jgi:hypothetical protein
MNTTCSVSVVPLCFSFYYQIFTDIPLSANGTQKSSATYYHLVNTTNITIVINVLTQKGLIYKEFPLFNRKDTNYNASYDM